MTENEWQTSEDAWLMLTECESMIRALPRKGRLFAVACCQRILGRMTDERSRAAVELAGRYAEGLAVEQLLVHAYRSARTAGYMAGAVRSDIAAEAAARYAVDPDVWNSATGACRSGFEASLLGPEAERAAQADLLRCIFGPLLFRQIDADPVWVWKDRDLLELAEYIYAENAFAQLPMLTNGLRNAGCDSQEILEHCLHPGPHVRGCWVIDLLLAK